MRHEMSTTSPADDAHSTTVTVSRFHPSTPGVVEINVESADQLDQELDKAINDVSVAATSYRIGIMVTRLSAGRYIVRAHPEVPFGLIRQRHQ